MTVPDRHRTGSARPAGLRRRPMAAPALTALLAQLVPPEPAAAPPGPERELASYIVLPSARRPRLLLPGGDGALAARLLAARYDRGGGPLRRAGRGLAGAALRTGVVPGLLGDRLRVRGEPAAAAGRFLGAHLAGVFGRPVLLTGSVRSRDPHSSQVLQAVAGTGADAGHTLGFVKLAGTPLTRELLRAETDALHRCAAADPPGIAAPRVLHAGRWHSLDLLVTSALALDRRAVASRSEPPPATVTQQIAGTGTRRRGVLAGSGYARVAAGRAAAVAAGDPGLGGVLLDTLQRLAAVPVELDFGGWHGDWVPWNFSPAGSAYAVWDWEYAAADVPLGFDLLHFFFGVAFFRDRTGFGGAVAAARRSGLPLLAQLHLSPAAARVTLALYAVEMALRRCDIRAAGGGSDDRRVFPEVQGIVASVTREACESYPS